MASNMGENIPNVDPYTFTKKKTKLKKTIDHIGTIISDFITFIVKFCIINNINTYN